jgi:hypothetical protein
MIHFMTYDQGVTKLYCTKEEVPPPYNPENVTIYPEYANCPACLEKWKKSK